MNSIRHIRRLGAILAGLAATLLTTVLVWVAGASAAFAQPAPPGGGGGLAPPALVRVHTIVAGGMPGWQITLIAVGSALAAATLAVLAYRAMAARRSTTPTAA